PPRARHSLPTRRSSDLHAVKLALATPGTGERSFAFQKSGPAVTEPFAAVDSATGEEIQKKDECKTKNDVKQINFTGLSAVIPGRSEEHTSELQSRFDLV